MIAVTVPYINRGRRRDHTAPGTPGLRLGKPVLPESPEPTLVQGELCQHSFPVRPRLHLPRAPRVPLVLPEVQGPRGTWLGASCFVPSQDNSSPG